MSSKNVKNLKRSQVINALADLASEGQYKVTRAGAHYMNRLFEEVAKVINELEAEERAEALAALEEDTDDE